jgi:hypothetical protein
MRQTGEQGYHLLPEDGLEQLSVGLEIGGIWHKFGLS